MIYYTDGACTQSKNWKGGAGVYCETTKEKFVFSEKETTNNKMEMKAMIFALQHLSAYSEDYEIHSAKIFTDSAYIVNCLKQKWYESWQKNGWKNSKKQPVKNKGLWQEMLKFREKVMSNVAFFEIVKVKAHAGFEGNEIADSLAVEGKQSTEEFNWRRK